MVPLTHDKNGCKVNADWTRVLEAAQEQRWRIVETKNGAMLLAPNGIGKVTIHATPSDHRALKNVISQMRREGGFQWPPKK